MDRQLSEQDFYFCKLRSPNFEPSCAARWKIEQGLDAWIDLIDDKKFVTTEKCRPFSPSKAESCGGCQEVLPELHQGSFKARPLGAWWEMQEWIRNHGSVLCNIDIMSDFKTFFKNNPKGVYTDLGEPL
jgi:hypothetical protein